MAEKTLENLFFETLRDMYYAERHIAKNLPTMADSAVSDKLVEAFLTHQKETEGQIKRLEQVFTMIDRKPTSKRCEAMDGLLAEGEEIMEDYAESPALDAGLIAAAQAVEHYEIARYATLHRWAKMLGLNDGASLLTETLEEEKRTDKLLAKLADAEANARAKA